MKLPASLVRVVVPELRFLPGPSTWTKANRFLNIGDIGLLTTCKESRSIYLKPRAAISEHQCIPSSCVKVYDSEGNEFYYEVSAKRDIVCFLFSSNYMKMATSLDWGGLLARLPFFHLPQTTEMNLAFEFDDSWAAGIRTAWRKTFLEYLEEASPRSIVVRAYRDWWHGTIPVWTRCWLIDRGGKLPDNYRVGAPRDSIFHRTSRDERSSNEMQRQ
jgi:hypothetical protein